MFFHVAVLEVAYVLIDHVDLDLIGRVLLCLSEVMVDLMEEGGKFSEEELDLDALILEYFFFSLH